MEAEGGGGWMLADEADESGGRSNVGRERESCEEDCCLLSELERWWVRALEAKDEP